MTGAPTPLPVRCTSLDPCKPYITLRGDPMPYDADELAQQLDGAHLVDYRPEHGDAGAVFAWFGGHCIYVYSPRKGRELDAFAVGDYGNGEITRADVAAGVEDWLRS